MTDDGHHPKKRIDMGVAYLRLDGFVSLQALWNENDFEEKEGLLLTRLFIVQADQVVVNTNCELNGYIKVEILDENDFLFC